MSKNKKIRLSEASQLIEQEIKWCKKHNKENPLVTKDFHDGFIAGLLQAKYLINKLAEIDDRERECISVQHDLR